MSLKVFVKMQAISLEGCEYNMLQTMIKHWYFLYQTQTVYDWFSLCIQGFTYCCLYTLYIALRFASFHLILLFLLGIVCCMHLCCVASLNVMLLLKYSNLSINLKKWPWRYTVLKIWIYADVRHCQVLRTLRVSFYFKLILKCKNIYFHEIRGKQSSYKDN